jgi:hypothetical protein
VNSAYFSQLRLANARTAFTRSEPRPGAALANVRTAFMRSEPRPGAALANARTAFMRSEPRPGAALASVVPPPTPPHLREIESPPPPGP